MDDWKEQNVLKRQQSLFGDIHNSINQIARLLGNNSSLHSKDNIFKEHVRVLKNTVIEFEYNLKLLIPKLDQIIGQLCSLFMENQTDLLSQVRGIEISKVIYEISRIVGFKTTSNYFPTDVYLIPKIVTIFSNLNEDNQIFTVLIWLSNLVLVPFPLAKIDADLPSQLFDLGIYHSLSHAPMSKAQLVASLLVSRLSTRPDLSSNGYFDTYVFKTFDYKSTAVDEYKDTLPLGHLLILNKTLKKIKDINVLKLSPIILESIYWSLSNIQYQKMILDNITFDAHKIRYMIKILAKLATVYIRAGRFDDVNKILNVLLVNTIHMLLRTIDTMLRFAFAKALSSISRELSIYAVNYHNQLISHCLSLIDDFEGDIDDSLKEIPISKLHMILLFLGYSALDKRFPRDLIPRTLKVVNRTVFFERKKMTIVFGTQIRDSSCFVIWSLCRCVGRDTISDILDVHWKVFEDLFTNLLRVAIFDSDFTIRRCGVAVIQEFMGRIGAPVLQKLLSKNSNVEKYLIGIPELFNSQSVSSYELSYEIAYLLVCTFKMNKFLFLWDFIYKISLEYVPFHTKRLSATYLGQILAYNSDFMLCSSGREDSVSKVIKHLRDNRLFFALFTVIEVGSFDYDWHEILNDLANSELHPSGNVTEDASSLFKGLTLVLRKTVNISFDYIDKIFRTVMVGDQDGLSEDLAILFNLLSNVGYFESTSNFNSLINCIVNGSIVAAKCAYSYERYSRDQFSKMFEITISSTVDCEIRSTLLNALLPILSKVHLTNDQLSKLILQLEDYTTTVRGDVGSKVRASALQLIDNNFKVFEKCVFDIELQLLRLSGELIDKLRIASFKLLVRLKSLDWETPENNWEFYFENLLQYYRYRVINDLLNDLEKFLISQAFWKGFVYTIGATLGASDVLNKSFIQFAIFFDSLKNDAKLHVLNAFMTLLKIPPGTPVKSLGSRNLKTFVTTLNVILRLFESELELPHDLDFRLLFVRTYNLLINTANFARIELCTKIFKHLYMGLDVPSALRNDIGKRIVDMALGHKLKEAKVLAAECLLQIAIEQNLKDAVNKINSVNWEAPSKELISYKGELTNIFSL